MQCKSSSGYLTHIILPTYSTVLTILLLVTFAGQMVTIWGLKLIHVMENIARYGKIISILEY